MRNTSFLIFLYVSSKDICPIVKKSNRQIVKLSNSQVVIKSFCELRCRKVY